MHINYRDLTLLASQHLKTLTLLSLLIFSSHTFSQNIESFRNIQVNPADQSSFKVTASVHINWANNETSQVNSLACNEEIAMTLKTLSINELKDNNGITTFKNKLKAGLGSNPLISSKIEHIFVTQLQLEWTGQDKVIYMQPAK